MNLTNMYRTFNPAAAESIFFSGAQGTFSRTSEFIGHKTSLSKCKKTEIISGIFSNHSGVKPEISNRRKRKIHKFVDIKQHTPEQPANGSRRNKQGNKKMC